MKDYEIYLKAVFDQCDSNSDGQLSYSEIVNALSSEDFVEIAVDAMGFVESGVSREEFARQFLEACDWDNDRAIHWDEFRRSRSSFGALDAMHEARMEHALREVFERIDTDGSGSIDIQEAWRVSETTPISLMC